MITAECEGHAVQGDALLAALTDARQRRDQADRDIRLLLAYAREIITPRPYRLADLAEVTGRSISGIRTAYSASDVEHARQLTGTSSGRGDQRHINAAVTTLLADRKPYRPVSGSSSATR
jgi:hypothetical protein